MLKDVSLGCRLNIGTVIRVALPSVAAAIFGYAYFDNISLFLYNNWLTAGEIQFLSSDEVQFIPSFLQVLGLLFSILAGTPLLLLFCCTPLSFNRLALAAPETQTRTTCC